MNSIITTYLDFQSLLREVTKLLLVSENYFFLEAHSARAIVKNWETSTTTQPPHTGGIAASPQPPTYGSPWAF